MVKSINPCGEIELGPPQEVNMMIMIAPAILRSGDIWMKIVYHHSRSIADFQIGMQTGVTSVPRFKALPAPKLI